MVSIRKVRTRSLPLYLALACQTIGISGSFAADSVLSLVYACVIMGDRLLQRGTIYDARRMSGGTIYDDTSGPGGGPLV